jgi:hypothetical protein
MAGLRVPAKIPAIVPAFNSGRAMPIDVSCPKCGSGLPVPDEFAGRTVRCGGCAELISVPGLAGNEVPPPLPGTEEPPPLPQARPVAKPVARAAPVRPEPSTAGPRPESKFADAAPKVRSDRDDDEPARARPQTKTALFVIAGLVLFGCCGVSVLGFAFVKLTNKVAEANKKDRFTPVTTAGPGPATKGVPDTPPTLPRPPIEPVTPKTRPTTPPRTPPTRSTPPTRPSPATPPADPPRAPSPQGMKGLTHYVSFNADPIREDTTRRVLTTAVSPILRDGPNRKAARFMATTDRDGDGPKFVCTLSGSAADLTFKENEPFTVALWVRGGGQDAVPFAATQAVRDQGTRLFMRADARGLRVDLFCDESNPKKSFSRSATRSMRDMITSYHHVALTRTADGTLKTFVDGSEMTDSSAESLPAKQPGELSFRHAGFGLRSAFGPYSFDIDEFCVFDRALSAGELKTLTGKGAK